MSNALRKLTASQKWFQKFINREFGKKCSDFEWECVVCRAHLTNDLLSGFVKDVLDTERWHNQRGKIHKKISH